MQLALNRSRRELPSFNKQGNNNFRGMHYWGPVVLWMSFIFWLSTGTFSSESTSLVFKPSLRFFMPYITSEMADMIHWAIRKCAHVTEYSILGVLLFRAFRGGSQELRNLRWAMSTCFVVLLYAVSDEFHQSYVSCRTASLADIGIDTAGGIAGQGLSVLWQLIRRS